MKNGIDLKLCAGRRYGGELLRDRQARRRQQFLQAGLEVFGTSGYRTATVRQLCRFAELTDRYFYESFATTEDLLVAVYEHQFSAMQQALVAAIQRMPSGDPHETVRAGLNALFASALDPRVARVCWLEVLGVSPRVDQVYRDMTERFAALVLNFTQQRLEPWTLGPEESEALSIALVGAVSQSVAHWLLGGQQTDYQRIIDANVRVFEGVLRTLPQPQNSEVNSVLDSNF